MAGRLKREIKNQLNLTPKMSVAAKGVLDVMLDGRSPAPRTFQGESMARLFAANVASVYLRFSSQVPSTLAYF